MNDIIIIFLFNTNDEFCMLDEMLAHPGTGILRGGEVPKIYKILLILTFSAMTAPDDYVET